MKRFSVLMATVLACGVSAVAAAPSSTDRGDDANGDGRSDLFWHSSSLGQLQSWYMEGGNFIRSPVNTINSSYVSPGVGDFNGDGLADVVWHDRDRTTVWVWLAQPGGQYQVVYLRSYPQGWEIVAIEDFNNDGRADLFWHNKSTGLTQTWNMDGASWTYGLANPIPSQYTVAGAGDVNGDGRADVIWHDDARQTVWLWQGRNDGAFDVSFLRSYPSGWHIDVVSDSNGDGRADIFWHNNSAGLTQSWYMNGASWSYSNPTAVGSQYQVAGSGDFNNDGLVDLIWRDSARTALYQWQARDDGGYNVISLGAHPAGWELLNY